MSCCDWLISLSTVSSRFILAVACAGTFQDRVILRCMCRPHFIHGPTAGHSRCLHTLATVSNTGMNVLAHISLPLPFGSCGFTPRSAIVGSHGNFMFTFLRHVCPFLTADLSPPHWCSQGHQGSHLRTQPRMATRAGHGDGTNNSGKAGPGHTGPGTG